MNGCRIGYACDGEKGYFFNLERIVISAEDPDTTRVDGLACLFGSHRIGDGDWSELTPWEPRLIKLRIVGSYRGHDCTAITPVQIVHSRLVFEQLVAVCIIEIECIGGLIE